MHRTITNIGPNTHNTVNKILGGSVKDKWSKNKLQCNFCGGVLGAVEKQRHDNPNFAEYRTCLKCGYQWAKQYWPGLESE